MSAGQYMPTSGTWVWHWLLQTTVVSGSYAGSVYIPNAVPKARPICHDGRDGVLVCVVCEAPGI